MHGYGRKIQQPCNTSKGNFFFSKIKSEPVSNPFAHETHTHKKWNNKEK
jgi:hypothetical protein